jgi:hypothetical protein
MKRITIFVICLACLQFAESGALAFRLPERMEYDLKWAGIKAGKSMLHIYKGEDGNMRIVSTARSADWITFFYPVEDRVESVASADWPWHPIRYHIKTREGRHTKDREVVFSSKDGKALFINHLEGEAKEFEIPEAVFDPLSAFYHFRFSDLDVGKSSYVTIFDSKRVWKVEVKVLRKERISVPAGTFDTVVIWPLMKSEGIFQSKGPIYIWLTDDERRIPVKLKTIMVIGSITAVMRGGEY